MNKERFNNLITAKEPFQNDQDLPLLKNLIENFPYYPSSYAMLSKLLYEQQSIYFDKYLKLAAAYIGDREVLYHYLHTKQEDGPDVVSPEPEENLAENEVASEAAQTEEGIGKETTGPNEKPSAPEPAAPQHIMMTVDEEEMASVDPVPLVPEAEVEREEVTESREEPQKPAFEYLPPSSYDYFGSYPLKEKEQAAKKSAQDEQAGETKSKKEKPFEVSSPHSFTEWLSYIDHSKNKTSEPAKNVAGDKADQLIEKFLNSDGKIKQNQAKFFSPHNMAQKSVEEDNTMITETLANIYLNQGLTEKAIEIFQQLALRYPQKSDYFAGKIEEVKNDRG